MDAADTRAPDRRRPPPRACARIRPTLNPRADHPTGVLPWKRVYRFAIRACVAVT
jgi:hypothetical protein